MKTFIARTLLPICLVAAVPLASAQTADPAAPHRPHLSQHHAQRPFSLPSERIDARLAYLKTALRITDAQQTQWNAFADVMRKHARDMDERVVARRAQFHEGAASRKQTAIERLEQVQQRHAEAVTRLNSVLAVEKPLYAALSPEQRQIADQVLVPHRPRGHMR